MEDATLEIQKDSPGELGNLLVNESVASGLCVPRKKKMKWKFGKHDHQ